MYEFAIASALDADTQENLAELSGNALFVLDESTGRWVAWGIFNSDSDVLAFTESEIATQLRLLKGFEPDLNIAGTRVLQNCWQSIPDLQKQVYVSGKFDDLFSANPFKLNSNTRRMPDSESRRRFCDILLRTPIVSIVQSLSEMVHIGPKRRDVPRGLSTQTTWGLTSWRDGSAAWKHLLTKGNPVLEFVSDWLSGIHYLNSGYALEIDASRILSSVTLMNLRKRMAESASIEDALAELDAMALELPAHQVLRLRADKRTLHFQDVGEGITQVVPILVALATFDALITVEQPELHLHPAMQGALSDVFLNSLSQNSQRSLLIETHSEHLILRILRRIRQTTNSELPEHIPTVKPDDVCVLWVDNLGDGTTFQRLRIDDQGEFIDRWPQGFFSERAEELF